MIKNLINAIASGNTLESMKQFESIWNSKVSSAIQAKREEVGSSLFSISKPISEDTGLEDLDFNLEDFSIEELEEFALSEKFEQLDEISKKTLASYINRAAGDVASSARTSGLHHGSGTPDRYNKINKYENDVDKRKNGIRKAVDKLTGQDKVNAGE